MLIRHIVETTEREKVRFPEDPDRKPEIVYVVRHTYCGSRADAYEFMEEGPRGTIVAFKYLGPCVVGRINPPNKEALKPQPRKTKRKAKSFVKRGNKK